MLQTKTRIGPRHHGRKMSLKAFEFADVEEGCSVELARGYLVVSNVANLPHGLRTAFIRDHLGAYRLQNPGVLYAILNSMECKVLIPEWESERHPDLAVYLAAPKTKKDRTLWRRWVPDLVIEVVSEGSRDRDYTEKRDEYWTLGVKEYWIVDAGLQQVLALKRSRTRWTEKTLGPADACETRLLPGFKLPCKAIFDAAQDQDAD